MNESAKKFREQYAINPSVETENSEKQFDPNVAAKEIELEQLKEFAKLVKDTPNENFVAFKDPKVQELVDYIMSAIILENERINAPDAFPLQIYRRYKSDQSLQNKMEEWATRPEKDGKQVTDYLGFKIIPEAEHSVFYSGGDPELQKLIEKRERVRAFISDIYQALSKTPKLTLDEYTKKCSDVIRQLYRCFPKEATSRRTYYQNKLKTLKTDFDAYRDVVEDANAPMDLQDIYAVTDVNIQQLLRELSQNYSNEVTLYKVHSDLMNTFENSELLRSLGLSVSSDSDRTKHKSTKNGYRSEFVGLDLSIFMDDGSTIELPIECQIQTMEQYRDGNVGFAAHTKLPSKGIKLKSIPKIGDGQRYTSPTGQLEECRSFLSHIMHISPDCAIAKTTGNDFESGRTIITPYDLYEAYRLISRVPKESRMYRAYTKYLGELYEKREELFPTGDSLLPKYIRFDDIPNPATDNSKYYEFFSELNASLKQTIEEALSNQQDKVEEKETVDQVKENDSHDEI